MSEDVFKKTIWIAAAFIFGLGVLVTSVYRTSAQTVIQPSLAQEDSGDLEFVLGGGSEMDQPASQEVVDYNLAWPGILPDHFLYPFKMIRDRIWLFLTSGSLKKAELFLKFADKRIWSAQMLVDKGKVELGVTTATKAVKYLQQAVDQEKVAREGDKDTMALLERLFQATLKHEEVLTAIRQQVSEEVKPVIDNSLTIVQKSHEEVKERLGE